MNRQQFIKAISEREVRSVYNVLVAFAKDKYNKEFPPDVFNGMMQAIRQTNTGVDQGQQWVMQAYEEAKAYFMEKFEVVTLMNENNILIKYY